MGCRNKWHDYIIASVKANTPPPIWPNQLPANNIHGRLERRWMMMRLRGKGHFRDDETGIWHALIERRKSAKTEP